MHRIVVCLISTADIFVQVGETDVGTMETTALKPLMLGPQGSRVCLTFRNSGSCAEGVGFGEDGGSKGSLKKVTLVRGLTTHSGQILPCTHGHATTAKLSH